MKAKRSIVEIFKGCKQAKYIPILKYKIKYSRSLYKLNKYSDEYMSTSFTYQRFLKKNKLKGKKIFEPFHGDGSFKKAFKQYANLPIVSNPPFSIKYQVMHTLLQLKRNFALVLPERTVINNILPKFKEAYGGKYKIFVLKGKENTYMCKNTNELKRINTVIVDWKF